MTPGTRGPTPGTSSSVADGHPRRDVRASRAGSGIPRFITGLVGRRQELGEIRSLCAEQRLVSLVGPAGIGKTRLAAAIATELSADRTVYWVNAGVGDPASCVNHLVAAISDQRNLVVLDGCHGRSDAVAAIGDLMRRSPRCRLLVTSRRALGFVDETVWTTPGLAVRPAGGTAAGEPADDADPDEATTLFLARCRSIAGLRAQSRVETDRKAAAICRHLQGVPLAIELVAAVAGPDELSQLPTALGRADGPGADPVGAALRCAHERLSVPEQTLLRRLAVFPADFDLAAACAVGGAADPLAPAGVRPVLQRLLAAALVQAVRVPGGRRFGLLDPVRRYAADQLTAGESAVVRRAHLAHFSELAAAITPPITTSRTSTTDDLDLLDAELGNFRTAFDTVRLLGASDDLAALRLAVALRRLCLFRGHYQDGIDWLRTALDASDDPPGDLLAAATAGLGNLSLLLCEYSAATRHLEQAVAMYRDLPDARGEAETLLSLGGVAREQGRYSDAEKIYQRALELGRSLDDPRLIARTENYRAFVAWLTSDDDLAAQSGRRSLVLFRDLQDSEGIAWSLLSLGVVARHQGATARAVALFESSLALSDWTGYAEGVAWSREQLGVLALAHRDPNAAEQLLLAALDAHRAIGDRWRTSSTLDGLAAAAVYREQGERGAQLLGAATAIRREIDVPVPQCERPDRERTERVAIEQLTADRFTELFDRGATAELEDVLSGLSGRATESEPADPTAESG